VQIGPYTIERELGRGGMGAVYLGRSAPEESPVAIKVVHTALSWDPDVEARFQAEGDALEALNHPNLVQLRSRGRGPGGHWIAMDYVEGQSLEAHLKAHGPWASEAARDLMIGLCAGIAHAHYEGVLHRDLKPENVILRAPNLHPLIVDFGLARPLDLSQHLTATGEILGSPGYLAPEQCGAGGHPTLATDVYGLGAVLYTVLTGEPPFRGKSLLGTLDMVLSAAPRPLRDLQPEVDPWLEAICLRCLAKDPLERFPDASSLADALQARASAPAPRRARGRTLAVTAALALVGGGAWLGWSSSGGPSGPGPSSASSAPSEAASVTPRPTPALWRTGRWGAKHLALGDRVDSEALRARYELISREADGIETREEAWIARRARAIKIARRGGVKSTEDARSWVLTVAVDDFYGDSLDETSELVAARDRARDLVEGMDRPGELGEGGPRLIEALARLELKAWRRLPPSERGVGRARVLKAWGRLSREEDVWWREAVRVEVLTNSNPVQALRALQAIELAAGSPSTQAWVDYLRARFLRSHAAQASEYLRLLETVGEWPGASPTLRSTAGFLRGAQLDLDFDPRARAALEGVDLLAVSPERRFGPRLRLARLSLRAGELAQSEELLASLPAKLAPEFRFHVALLRSELRAREGKPQEASAALLEAPAPTNQDHEARLLYLRAALGQVDHAEALAGSLSARGIGGVFEADRVLRRAALDPLWKEHAGPAVERLAKRVRARLAGSKLTRELLESMLRQGRWRELISLTRAALAEREPRRYASLVAHALLAAEEADVPREEIARTAEAAATAIRGVSITKLQAKALVDSVALRQSPAAPGETQARDIAACAEILERAQAEDGAWAIVPAELIRLYDWAGQSHPEFRGLGHGVALRWLAEQERNVASVKAVCTFEQDPQRMDLLNSLVQGGPMNSERSQAILVIRRWRRLTGADLGPIYDFVHEPKLRLATRREFLLEETRRVLEETDKESAEAALVVLGRLRRWCPPGRPQAEIELLEARANLQAGHLSEANQALARVREIQGLDPGVGAELLMLEGRRLQLLGRPREEFGAKVVASLAGARTRASSLDCARMSAEVGGSDTATLYGQALGYERSLPEVKRILSEVARTGADPLVALEIGARELALRASALKAMSLVVEGSRDLPPSDGLLELQAMTLVRLSRARLERGLDLPREDAPGLLKGAWGKRGRLLLEVHQVRRAARAPGGAGRDLRLLELQKALALEVEGASRETCARWALRWELAQISMDLTQRAASSAERVAHAERAEALFAEAEEEEHPEPARAMDRAYVLSEVLSRHERAVEVLGDAVESARAKHQGACAGVLARARAVVLFNLGRFEEALSALEVAIASGLEPTLRGEAYLQQALCLKRLGREGVLPSLRRARISTPLANLSSLLEIKTLEARWGSESAPQARQNLARVEYNLDQLEPEPRAQVRSMIRVAEAELWRHQGELERALEVLDKAMSDELPPGAVDERLASDQAAGAKGRIDLLKWGPAVLEHPRLLPYEAERVRAALKRAKAR